MSQVFTVIGATGAQGSAVVNQALKDGVYKVRAITRNVNGEQAKALHAKGVEVVSADVNSEESLLKAFNGSTAIYAVTNFFEPFASGGPEHAMKVELQQGKNIADAAAKTATLKHLIWSTLPDSKKISNGKYVVPHLHAKARVDEYIKTKADLSAKTTFLWVGWYAQNYQFPMFTPNFAKSSGKYIQLQPVPPTVKVVSVGDISKNLGLFTSAILAKPQVSQGKYVLGRVETTTMGDMLQAWGEVTGKQTAYVQTSSEDFNAVWPMWAEEMGLMVLFWNEYGEKSWSGEDFLTSKELGIGEKFVSIRESFKEQDFSYIFGN